MDSTSPGINQVNNLQCSSAAPQICTKIGKKKKIQNGSTEEGLLQPNIFYFQKVF